MAFMCQCDTLLGFALSDPEGPRTVAGLAKIGRVQPKSVYMRLNNPKWRAWVAACFKVEPEPPDADDVVRVRRAE